MSLLAWPAGDNATDSFFPPSLHLNRTTLKAFDYRLWSNHTVSNGSSCFILGLPTVSNPAGLLDNGTFVNATWCDVPILPIGPRGITSLSLIGCYGVCLLLALVGLARLGKLYVTPEKRFRPIGRRWQWYWAVVVCGFGVLSLVMNVDLDRVYVCDLQIIITSFAWFLMQLALTALVWESIRHWGSWQERQIVDPDPWALKEDDRRARVEFWLPLLFYLFWWLSFFILIPRNWSTLELQRAPTQTPFGAKPMATDTRFKAGAFVHVACFIIILVSLYHSIRHYKLPASPTAASVGVTWVRYIPLRIAISVTMLAAHIAYQILCSFWFEISVLDAKGNLIAIFAGGYGPSFVILLTQGIFAVCSTNEDKKILEQRRRRGADTDRALGIVRKPAWWRLLHRGQSSGDDVKDQLAQNTREIAAQRAATQGDGDATAEGEGTEMRPVIPALPPAVATPPAGASPPALYTGRSEAIRAERTIQAAARLLFPNAAPPAVDRRAELPSDGPPPPYTETLQQSSMSTATRTSDDGDAGSINGSAARPPPPPRQVRSMLDV